MLSWLMPDSALRATPTGHSRLGGNAGTARTWHPRPPPRDPRERHPAGDSGKRSLGDALRAQAEQLDGVPHVGEPRLGGDLLRPLLHRPALHLHAPAAVAAGQVVVVHARLALPVEDLAAGVADGVDVALLAERLQVPVDGGQ